MERVKIYEVLTPKREKWVRAPMEFVMLIKDVFLLRVGAFGIGTKMGFATTLRHLLDAAIPMKMALEIAGSPLFRDLVG